MLARVLHRRYGFAVPVLFDGRRVARWLVEEHGWVVMLHPVILLLGLVTLLTVGR